MSQLRVALWLAVSSEAQAKEDKISLREQERVGHEWVAHQPDARIVKVFHWDGYSRSETDVLTAYDDFAAQGRFEYHELRQMWQAHGFDVLWVYVHDRIARSTALYAQVMGNVIKSGARIFSHTDGWIEESNVETFMAIGGFSAAGDIRKLVKRRKMGMRNRLKQGRSTSSVVPATHTRVRDPKTGDEVGLIINENNRRLFADAAQLVLEGIGWQQIERQLYERFGHVAKSGKPYAPGWIYNRMMSPMTWGHNALNHRLDRPGTSWAHYDEWIFEPGHDIPPGVIIEYNVLPAVYEGDVAEQLKREIKFRMTSVRGHTASKDKYWFTGLVVCDDCGYYLHTYVANSRKPRLKCATHWLQSHKRGDCAQRLSLMADHLQEWFTSRIQQMIDSGDYSLIGNGNAAAPDNHRAALEQEISDLDQSILTMIRAQSKAGDDETLFQYYADELAKATPSLDIKKRRLAQIEFEATADLRSVQECKVTVDKIQNKGWAWFWSQDAPAIRNDLLSILSGQRLSAREGKIKQVVPAPKVYGKSVSP